MRKNKTKLFTSIVAATVMIALLIILGLSYHADSGEKASPRDEPASSQTKTREMKDKKNPEVKKAAPKANEAKKETTLVEVSEKNEEPKKKAEEVDSKPKPAAKTSQAKAVKAVKKEGTKKEGENQKPSIIKINPAMKFVNVSSLNVRSGPGTSNEVVGMVRKGQSATVYERTDSWSHIKFSHKSGWVSSKYLTAEKPLVKKTEVEPEKHSKSKPTVTSDPKTDSRQTPATVADQLKTVSRNRQLILVTTKGTNTYHAKIRTFEKDESGKWKAVLSTTGYVGKLGLTANKKEGDKKAPIGKFSIGTAFGRKGNPGTKLAFRSITSDDIWVDDSKSPLYNTWQSKSKTKGQWNSAENMNIPQYDYGFVINYNTGRTPYKGSAIFFHVNGSYTVGCTATSRTNVIRILKWLDPAKQPVIIQTPVKGLSNF